MILLSKCINLNIQQSKPIMDQSKDIYTCGLCQCNFTSFLTFVLHKIDHVGPASVVTCIMCDLQFSEAKSYEDHLQHIHSFCVKTESTLDDSIITSTLTGSAQCSYVQQKKEEFHQQTGSQVNEMDTAAADHIEDSICSKNTFDNFDVVATNVVLHVSNFSGKHVKGKDISSSDTGREYEDKQDEAETMNEWLKKNQKEGKAPEMASVNVDHIKDSDNLVVLTSRSSSVSQKLNTNKPLSDGAINESIMSDNLNESNTIICSVQESKDPSENTLSSTHETEFHCSELVAKKSSLKPLDNKIQSSKSNGQDLIQLVISEGGKGSTNLYTHVRSLLSSPLLSEKAVINDNKTISLLVKPTWEKDVPVLLQRLGDSCISPDNHLLSVDVVTSVTSQTEYSLPPPIFTSAIQPLESPTASFHSAQSNTSAVNSLQSSNNQGDENDDLLLPSTKPFLVPVPLDLSVSGSFSDSLNFSHTDMQAVLGQGTCLAPSASSPSIPIVSSRIHSLIQKQTDNVTQPLTEQNKIGNEKDSKKTCKKVDVYETLKTCTNASNACTESSQCEITTPFPNTNKVNPVSCPQKLSNVPEVEDCNPVDFYFLLGTMNIQGTSLTYDRIDFRCLHCTFSTAWRPSLVKHMKQFHKEAFEIHKILHIRNTDSLDTEIQELEHTKCKKFRVMKMSEYLAGNQKTRKRVRKLERQDIPGKYSCSICLKVFSRLRYLRRHQVTHRTERAYLCDNCGKSFKTKAILVAHRRSHKTKIYHCPQCSFVSCSSAAIHIHRQLHPNGSVVCDICGTAYIDKSTLNKHRKVHDLLRPFPCTFSGCTWRFKTDVMRKAHVRSHTTVGKFHCPHCGYNFRQKHHLHRHIAKIHSGQQLKTECLLPSSILSSDLSQNLTATSVPFSTQGFADGHDSSALANEQDLLKLSVNPHDALTLSGEHHVIHSPPSSHLLCSVSDAPFHSNLGDQELAMIEILVGDKHETLGNLEEEEERISIGSNSTGSFNNLDYITENGQVVQLVRPGQTYMGRDQYGNLVQYKIADIQDHEDTSQPIYFIGIDGTVVGTTNSQEQALVVNSSV